MSWDPQATFHLIPGQNPGPREGWVSWQTHTYKEQQVEEEEEVLGDFDTGCPHPAGCGAPWREREGEQVMEAV